MQKQDEKQRKKAVVIKDTNTWRLGGCINDQWHQLVIKDQLFLCSLLHSLLFAKEFVHPGNKMIFIMKAP
jgi:hypothetical protein